MVRKTRFKALWPLLTSLLLSSCALNWGGTSSSSFSSYSQSAEASSSNSGESSQSQNSQSSSSSSNSSESSQSEDSQSSSSSVIKQTRELDFYAINDFHGQILEDSYFPGIETLGTYLKQKKQQPNTFLINSGDMFQGSLESNYNRGHLLTDIMNDIQFDCFSLGNHEFDWGLQAIRDNKARKSPNGYQTPFLSANLYDYEGNVQQSDLSQEYVVKEADNGLRVGIIGAIGKNQITSISSQLVEDLSFLDPAPIVQSISDKLRQEENCDVVVLSLHASQSTALGRGITSISPNSGKRYVDLVFCAHTHKFESTYENGVLFTQNDDKGENLSRVKLTVSPEGEVGSTLYTVSQVDMQNEVTSFDSSIASLVSSYGEVTEAIGAEVLGEVDGYFNSGKEAANMMAESLLLEAESEGYDVDLAMANTARTSLSSGSLTYSGLFSAFPFDNEIYIADVSGEDLINEAKYNNIARRRSQKFVSSETYRIAVIDYLVLHQNSNREYDYFPSAKIVGKLKEGDSPLLYREILAGYIRDGGSLSSSSYSSSLSRYNVASLTSDVTLN